MERVCIFIDGSNFYHALKAANLPVSVDLGKLGVKLTGPDRRHVHTYYYNTPLKPVRAAALEFLESGRSSQRTPERFAACATVTSDVTVQASDGR